MHQGVSGIMFQVIKKTKVDSYSTINLLIIQAMRQLFPLALYGDHVYLYVQNNEAPQLVEFIVHPELFRF